MSEVSNPDGIDPQPPVSTGNPVKDALRANRAQQAEQTDLPPVSTPDVPEPEEYDDIPTEQADSPEPEEVSTFRLGDEEVTADQILEWKSGYLRNSDYTQKTQATAEERKEAQRQLAQAQELAKSYQSANETVEALKSAFLPKEPDIALSHQDPIQYMQQKAAYDQAMETWSKQLEAAKSAAMQANQTQQQAMQQAMGQHRQSMQAKYPELYDPARRGEWESGFKQVADAVGLTQQDLSQANDPRIGGLFLLALRGLQGAETAKKVVAKTPAMSKSQPRKAKSGAQADLEKMRREIGSRRGRPGDAKALLKAQRKARST